MSPLAGGTEKIIVVDDDPMVGDLTQSLLQEAGYDADLISDSRAVIAAVKAKLPALVILDVLMPGIDGLTLCRMIKEDPDLSAVKVCIVSGKSFEADKARAGRLGADLFIEKPYKVETFAEKIRELLGVPAVTHRAETETPPAFPDATPPGTGIFSVAIWGCRAQPQPQAPASRYGRHSPCVSVEFDGRLFVFDGGSGLNALAEDLAKTARHDVLWMFLSNFQPDHTAGLERFSFLRRPGTIFHLSGSNDPEKSLHAMAEETFGTEPGAAPVAAEIQLYEMIEESYEILPGVRVTCFYANHPGTTLGFKLVTKGRTFIYCPSSELYGEAATALQDYDEKLGALCAEADLLIHDARYVDSDYQERKNQGHSSVKNSVDFAARFGIKELLLFNLDASYSDAALDAVALEVAGQVADKGYTLRCSLAREGQRLTV